MATITFDDILKHEGVVSELYFLKNQKKRKKYSYGKILEMVGLPDTESNRRVMSDYCISKYGRRRIQTKPRSKSVSVEEETKEQYIEPQGTLFFPTDKERFLLACQAFADVYFKD